MIRYSKILKNNFSFFFCLFSFVLIFSCGRDWNNIFDPDNSTDKSSWEPQNLVVEQISVDKLSLTWEHTNPRITGYKIDRKIGDAEWENEVAIIDDSDIKEWQDDVAGLKVNHTYRVYAYADEVSSNSISQSIVPTVSAPSNLLLSQIDEFSVQLTWQDNCVGESGFKIDRMFGGSWQTAVGRVGEDTTTWIDTSAPLGTALTYRIYAYLNNDSGPSITNTISTNLPAPQNLNFTFPSETEAELTWTAHPFAAVTGYRVERRIDDGEFELITTTSNTEYTESGISKDTEYAFRVQAVTAVNESQLSTIKRIAWIGPYEEAYSHEHNGGLLNAITLSNDRTKVGAFFRGKSGTISTAGKIMMWDLASGSVSGEKFTVININTLAFNGDNSMLVSGGERFDGNKVVVWNSSCDSLWRREHGAKINHVDFQPNSSHVLSCGNDVQIKIWDVTAGTVVNTKPGMYGAFSPNNNQLATINGDQTFVWNLSNDELIWTLNGYIYAKFSDDNTKLITASASGFTVWNLSTGSASWSGSGWDARFSPDNSQIISLSSSSISIWDSESGNLLSDFDISGSSEFNLSYDHANVITGAAGATLIDVLTENTFWNAGYESSSDYVNFGPDDEQIIIGNGSRVYVWSKAQYWQIYTE